MKNNARTWVQYTAPQTSSTPGAATSRISWAAFLGNWPRKLLRGRQTASRCPAWIRVSHSFQMFLCHAAAPPAVTSSLGICALDHTFLLRSLLKPVLLTAGLLLTPSEKQISSPRVEELCVPRKERQRDLGLKAARLHHCLGVILIVIFQLNASQLTLRRFPRGKGYGVM